MKTLKFTKVRDVKSPERGTPFSAGIDFFIPSDFRPTFLFSGYDILIPSGIKVSIPKGYMLMAADKSGVVTSRQALVDAGKKFKPESLNGSIIVGAKIIDEDYQGEIGIHLINVSKFDIYLKPNMKIAQFILVPVEYCAIKEVAPDNLYEGTTLRGEGGWGSTNK